MPLGKFEAIYEFNIRKEAREESVEVVKKVIHDMDIVLKQIVPGLRISLKDLGTQTLENGGIGRRIELVSHKNSKEIPLRQESEGIKKIINRIVKDHLNEENNRVKTHKFYNFYKIYSLPFYRNLMYNRQTGNYSAG